MKIAALGDLHYRIPSNGLIHELLDPIINSANILILAGDLTDNGRVEEAEALIKELEGYPLPILAVLGNHDHDAGKAADLVEIFRKSGILILEGECHEIDQVGFVGIKGFCGGFEGTLVQPFGEMALKTFVQVSIDEAVQLENALVKLATPNKVAILHYSPIRETLRGEPDELYPFLGSSRLGNVLDRQGVNYAVHGHAHHGFPEGVTPGGVPVFNVSRFVQQAYHDRSFCLIDI
jgi:uncharacterized protein